MLERLNKGNGVVIQYSDDNCQAGYARNLATNRKNLVSQARNYYIFFETDKSEVVLYKRGFEDNRVEAARSLGFLYDGTWTFESMYEKIREDMLREARVATGLKSLRPSKKCDVFEVLCYSALASNGSPMYPYFTEANKVQLEKLVAKHLKFLLNLPKTTPTSALYEAAGLARPHLLFLVENLMYFYKGAARGAWPLDGETVDHPAVLGMIDAVDSNPISRAPIKFAWTTFFRTVSQRKLPEIHAVMKSQPLNLTRKEWSGFKITVKTMDDIGRESGYAKLSSMKDSSELSRARLTIAVKQEYEIRKRLRNIDELIMCTDGSVSEAENTGGCGGATFWYAKECEEMPDDPTNPVSGIAGVEPLCVSTAIVTSPLPFLKVDSFDAECFAQVRQLRKTTEVCVSTGLRWLIKKLGMYSDPNSILEAFANYDDSSNHQIYLIEQEIELLREACMNKMPYFDMHDISTRTIAPEREFEVDMRWCPGHSQLYFNDAVDAIASAAILRYKKACQLGLEAHAFKKIITPTILRRLLESSTSDWWGPDDYSTCAPVLLKRAKKLGPFRPKSGALPSRLLEVVYYYFWCGAFPEGMAAAGLYEYEEGIYYQKCTLCNTKSACHATHLLCKCEKLEDCRKETFGLPRIPEEEELVMLKNPKKVFSYLLRVHTKMPIFKQHIIDDITRRLPYIGESVEKSTKAKVQLPNFFRMLKTRYEAIDEEFRCVGNIVFGEENRI